MKRSVFPLLILSLVLIFPVLTGCPQDSGGDTIPSGNLGDNSLVLKGKVYRATLDLETITLVHTPYTAPDVVGVDMGTGTGWEILGTTPLTNGEFEISIDKPSQLISFSSGYFFHDDQWKNPKADPADVQIAELSCYLEKASTSLRKMEQRLSGNQANFSFTGKEVRYLYVDKDVVITLEDASFPQGSVTIIYKAAVLELKKGWNALSYDQFVSGSGSLSQMDLISGSANWSVSVGNPDLKWTFNSN